MRLIDADALIKEAFDLMDRNELLEDVPQIIKDYCDAQPTVDAVPVIRCKDCKHHYYHEMLKQNYCEITNIQFGEIEPNGYCHRAERKDNETD